MRNCFDPSTGYFWIVNQILSKNLQNTDDESCIYTSSLMDKLEQVGLALLVDEEEESNQS
jgi:hypothetical protein